MATDAILDKIISQRHAEEIRVFDPLQVVDHLLLTLTERERAIVQKRFAIPGGGSAATLEEIGRQFKVTRERVRQITKSATDKLRTSGLKHEELKRFVRITEYLLRCYGGALSEKFFIEQLLEYAHVSGKADERARACLTFLLREVLQGFVEYRPASGALRELYVIVGIDSTLLDATVRAIVDVIDEAAAPLPLHEVLGRFRRTDYFRTNRERLVAEPVRIAREFYGTEASGEPSADEEERVLVAYVTAAADLGQNIFGDWGRQAWPTIRPRRMNDKIYLILRQAGAPLHFTAIAERINAARFDKKVAKPPSVHNELILDDRFVLIGRGTYALREWGYKPGTVADVIAEILRDVDGLTRDDIVREVLRRRMVKRQTIHIALLNRDLFNRDDAGRYRLRVAPAAA